MSRAEKIQKLGNAIRSYRGLKSLSTGKWSVPPKTGARLGVAKWLAALGLDVPSSMEKIDGFKTVSEFNSWISSL